MGSGAGGRGAIREVVVRGRLTTDGVESRRGVGVAGMGAREVTGSRPAATRGSSDSVVAVVATSARKSAVPQTRLWMRAILDCVCRYREPGFWLASAVSSS